MIVRLVLIFILLFASVCLGILLHQDPGYLYISFQNWTVEMTLWIAIMAIIVVFFILYFVLASVRAIANIPSSWHHWRQKRRAFNARKRTRRGLIEFSEGHWKRAHNHLLKALPNAETPLLNYLTAARAAQEMGDSQLRDEDLRQAQHSMPEACVAVELTQAQLQLANQQWEQALATLKHLQSLSPNHSYVLKLLMHLYQEVRDWPQLLTLLPKLKQHRVVSDAEYQTLQQKAYLNHVNDLIKHQQNKVLSEIIASLPKRLVYDPEIMATYSRYLIENQDHEQAELLLRKSIRKSFNETLVALYGRLNSDAAQINFLESLCSSNPHSAALYLSLGTLCQEKNLWGKAQTYIEKSIEQSKSPEGYFALGRLYEHLNDKEHALKAYRQGLMLI